MKNLALACIACLMLLISACKKETTDPPVSSHEYFSLKIGNYWVYQHFQIDSMGNETTSALIDSLVISRDTIINNHIYYVMEGVSVFRGSEWKIQGYYRDSANCLVSSDGQVLLSETNFTDTINRTIAEHLPDTFFTIFTVMDNPMQQVTVPAGGFDVLNAKGYLTMYFPYLNPSGQTRTLILNRYYGKHTGDILQTYCYQNNYYENGTYYERRLLRYHIAP